jgi:hypothetical protein
MMRHVLKSNDGTHAYIYIYIYLYSLGHDMCEESLVLFSGLDVLPPPSFALLESVCSCLLCGMEQI